MTFEELKTFFEAHDNYTILTHRSPDGDTLGCGFALCAYLRSIGKLANVVNHENFPVRYNFLYEGYYVQEFEEQTIVAVDIADEKLFGDRLEKYAGRVDLCIDHHISNKLYAKETILDGKASAAALVLYRFFTSQEIPLSNIMAKCLYTAIATDTGCFKFENTTPEAHIAAAELIKYDIDFVRVNRMMFELKTKQRLKTEQLAVSEMEYYFGDRCSLISLSFETLNTCGVEPAEFDGLASLPLSVEGVVVGITIKQREENLCKLSVRTTDEMDASAICRRFGGGGHLRAAGCEIPGALDEVKAKILAAVGEELEKAAK